MDRSQTLRFRRDLIHEARPHRRPRGAMRVFVSLLPSKAATRAENPKRQDRVAGKPWRRAAASEGGRQSSGAGRARRRFRAQCKCAFPGGATEEPFCPPRSIMAGEKEVEVMECRRAPPPPGR